jgi:hypothetical protein
LTSILSTTCPKSANKLVPKYKFLNTVVLNQNLYLGTNLFADLGQVVDKIDVNPDFGDEVVNYDDFFRPGSESLHVTAGIGLKVGLNDNFVISFDYGMAADDRDGNSGFYVNLNWQY